MNKNGAIIIIEDDEDDQFLLEQAFNELGYENDRMYFPDGVAALEYLHGEISLPFLILSDINLPMLDGLDLRRKLKNDADMNLKCIPYLYLTTALNHQVVIDAYSASAQGFFVKPSSYEDIKDTIRLIVEYWRKCATPNNFLK
ncbi:response regulator [Dyadobacter psychrotolerans]|uniref:Response regulator n=1 Tax=Dyadobacter psychrotolerans TaxID=2541721 RepID=A0A4R5DA89_9BACT|nr:response regulator [Dyadobacter psychrotolerans]TDE08691.1 response regulator [Dyadobacter psychrotolerans]